MQFFPPLDVNPGQASLANFGFAHAEPRTDQDFSGVLSNQMERQDVPDPKPSEPASPAVQEPEGPPPSEHGAVGEDTGRRAASGAGDDGFERSEEAREDTARHADVRDKRQAKAAGDEQSETTLSGDAGDGDHSAEQVTEASADPDAGAEGAAGTDAAVSAEELREAVAALARRAEGLEEAIPGIAAGIREVQELVRRFRESAPSERGELGKAIAARIQALREEMASARQEDGGAAVREQATKAAAGSTREAGTMSGDASGSARKGKKDGDESAIAEASHGARVVSKAADAGSVSAAKQVSAPLAEGSVESVRARGEAGEAGTRPAKMDKTAAAHVQDTAGDAGAMQGEGKSDVSRAESVEMARQGTGKDGDESAHARERAGKTPPTDARERPAVIGKEGEADGGEQDVRPELRDRAEQREPRTVHDGALDASRSRDARAASETASTGLAGRGEAVRDRGRDLAPGQVSVADAADGSGRSAGSATAADGGRRQNSGDARQGFFSSGDEGRQASDKTTARTVNAATGKNVPEAQLQAAGTGQDSQPAVQQRLEGPVNSRSAEVYRQVESGAFRNLGQGVRQLVIRLDPADLGQISVILQVRGKEVQAVLRASNQETSHALGEQMSQLRAHLESQGLRVSRLEVQTQLADSQQQSQWQGAEQHNRYQENREQALSAQRWRNMGRVDSGLVRDVQTVLHREKLSQDGLDIFA